MSPLELMAIQINTLFRTSATGRLCYVNEPGPDESCPPAPRFFMGRTCEGNLWRFHTDLPPAIVSELDELCRNEPIVDDLTVLPRQADAIRTVLARSGPVQEEYQGPAYWIATDPPVAANAVLLTPNNLELLRTNFPDWLKPPPYYELGPAAVTVVDGQAVAICCCVRVPGRATEAGVETAPAYRGRGYAGAAVALWAAGVRQRGLLPLYDTGWDNLASQRVAAKLGMVQYGEDWSIY